MPHLRGGIVHAGRDWTDDGRAHQDRHLKARAERDSRVVPIRPHFAAMLRRHIERYRTARMADCSARAAAV
jgi:hypothetical protein